MFRVHVKYFPGNRNLHVTALKKYLVCYEKTGAKKIIIINK